MIEEIVLDALEDELKISAYMEVPEQITENSFFVIERTGGGERGYNARTATIAVQSYGSTLYNAATLNEQAVDVLTELQYKDNKIISCELNSCYNFTDTETKRYRYQAVFDLVYLI